MDRAISPEASSRLLLDLLNRYLANLAKIRISTLDAMCRSISNRRGSICTFTNCLSHYLAVAPDGGIYPCQRFTGKREYRLGSVLLAKTSAGSSATRRLRTSCPLGSLRFRLMASFPTLGPMK